MSFFQPEPVTSVAMRLFMDASNLGVGGMYGNEWFSMSWPTSWAEIHINVKELFAIVAATFLLGRKWENKQILFFTDNLSTTQVWLTNSSPNLLIMKLVWHLFFFSAHLNINILMEHISGQSNSAADALSHSQITRFHQLCPKASTTPTALPQVVWTLLD